MIHFKAIDNEDINKGPLHTKTQGYLKAYAGYDVNS